jgi:hypothetical protein
MFRRVDRLAPPRIGASPVIARYATPVICSWLIDAGAIATPSSAATGVITEAICGATSTITGSNPVFRHAPTFGVVDRRADRTWKQQKRIRAQLREIDFHSRRGGMVGG